MKSQNHADLLFRYQKNYPLWTCCFKTVNQAFNLKVLECLRQHIHWKIPNLWPGRWNLHHNYVPSHIAYSVKQFLVKNQISVFKHPLYSPDLALWNNFMFLKLKISLKVSCFVILNHFKTFTAMWWQYWNVSPPTMFPCMAETLECMYNVRRQELRR